MVMVAVMMTKIEVEIVVVVMEVVAKMTIKLQRMFLYMSLGGNMHSFLLGTDLRVELLGHRTGVCLALVDVAKQFSKRWLYLHFYL